jgi:hypothetical protein
MNLENRLMLDKIIEKMDSLSKPKVSGEISFETLVAISREQDGWIGTLLQALLRAIEEDQQNGEPETHLHEVAAIALKWSNSLREKRANPLDLPKSGEKVTVRVPEHRLRYLGTVTDDGKIFISFLQKTFTVDEIEILRNKDETPQISEASLDFQHAIDSQMAFLRSQVFENES